jgi:hypothetical protein
MKYSMLKFKRESFLKFPQFCLKSILYKKNNVYFTKNSESISITVIGF